MTEGARRLRTAAARLRSHQTTRLLAGAALRGLGLGLGVVAALLLAERFVALPAVVRAAGLIAAAGLPLAVLGHALLLRLPALRNAEEAARRTEAQAAVLRERLVPALQVLDTRDDFRTGYSTELVDAFVDDTATIVERVLPSSLPYNAGFRTGALTAAVAVALAVLAVGVTLPSGLGRGLARLAGAFGELGPRPAATFLVDPGDVSVPRGEPVTLAARVDHVHVQDGSARATLQWRTDDDTPWTDLDLPGQLTASGAQAGVPVARFEHRFAAVQESFRYRFSHGAALSPEYGVQAVPPPSLTIDEVRYHYPEYTGLPVRSEKNGDGDLAAVKGSTAEIIVRSTNEPRVARLELESGPTQELAPGDDARLRARVEIVQEDAYTLFVEDQLGLTNPNPLSYRIRALADEAPFIRLLEPGEDRDLDESLRVALRFSAVDDFGLGPVKLVWEVSRREGESQERVVHRPGERRTELNERWEWDLGPLGLLPGDAVTYHLEVTDNNAVDGPSRARTRDYVLRFPTLGEIYAEIDEKGESSIEDLAEMAEEAKRVEERVEEISREILKQGESSWENRKEVERALQTQEQLAQELKRIQDEIGSNMDKLAESEFSTLEALQKMEQIQKLMDEVADDKMKEALEKLRRALEETNPRRMQEDLAEFRMSQDELMEQLERIAENLKQFRMEERLKAAVRQMEELAARQEQVNDELRRATKPEDPGAAEERQAGEENGEESKAEDPESGEERAGDQESGEESKSGEEKAGDQDSEDPKSGEQKSGEQKSGEQKSGEPPEGMENLARQEEALAEEARRLEQELKDLAEMTRELRDAQDQKSMDGMAQKMDAGDVPETMNEMSEQMRGGDPEGAEESGEKALTELRELLTQLQQTQQGMAMRQIQISQAAINRAVRDLLSISGDEEKLAGDLSEMPTSTNSATRGFADEQHLLIQGAVRVEDMLKEVAKDTPLMDSALGQQLKDSIRGMMEAAYGLENGAVHMARDDGARAVEDLNAVVIALLLASESMSSCASGMPTSGFMQQLQDLSGDQQKLNEALQELMRQGGSPMDQRLQAQLRGMAEEQQRIKDQLQQLLDEAGFGQSLLGRLDQVTEKMDEVAKKLAEGRLDDETLREQDWALTRLLDSQRSMRERDFGRQRESRTGEDLADLLSPDELPEGLEDGKRDLREDLLKALDRRYPPKYEELIRRYFRSLSDEQPGPDLP
jgi:hypothetical protein